MISVIITAYNVSVYIKECIDSVLQQTLQDFEIIIVEDKSTDNTLEIIKSIKDDRIKIVENDINLGAGKSRQVGIDNAAGDYIIFLDGDDYIDQHFLKTLYDEAIKVGSDFCECRPILRYLENGNIIPDNNAVFLNSAIIKRAIFNLIKYCPRRYIEDTPTRYEIECVCKNHTVMNYAGYYYRFNPNSLCNSSTAVKDLFYEYLAALDYERLSKKYNKINRFPKAKYHLAAMQTKGIKFADIEHFTEDIDNNTLNTLKQI